jgi:L-seryl-tRNA(Ser) seleniumtransferase
MDIYEELGVPKAINAWGHITREGGSKMAPEVLEAMVEASRHFVDMPEFKAAVGRRIAELTHNEACEVCCGAATGLVLATAACTAGTDPAAMAQLPNLAGLKNEVIVHRAQTNPYVAYIRRVGVTIREIGTARATAPWELETAIGPQTAAVFFFAADYYNIGAALSLEDTIAIAHRSSVPVVVDAAANLPPAENLWHFTQLGADLAVFSGGKGLCGPQPSGLILGRKDLVNACAFANSPNHAIGRPNKMGKEEVAGVLAAVKWFLNLDQKARIEQWEGQVAHILRELNGIAGVNAERYPTGESGGPCPRVRVRIDEARLGRTMGQILKSLRAGDPWIAVGPSSSPSGAGLTDKSEGFFVNPQTLDPGEEEIVARRLRQAFGVKAGTRAA